MNKTLVYQKSSSAIRIMMNKGDMAELVHEVMTKVVWLPLFNGKFFFLRTDLENLSAHAIKV